MAFTSVSFFPAAVGMLMSRDHRLVHCSLMINSPCILGPRPFRPMKHLSFSPTDYHCDVWRKVSNFVGPGEGNFLILGHSRRRAVCYLQSLLDFFKADLRQSPDMASEYSTNLEEVSAIFQYLTRVMLNLRRLRQKISASALSVPPSQVPPLWLFYLTL